MSSVDADVVVVGAGIIGLASAVSIAQSGRTVCVLDPAPGSGASHAAAGMLCPGAEWAVEDAVVGQQMRDARAAWPSFAARIRELGRVPLGVHEVGSLFVAWDGSDRREWQRHLDVIAAQGVIAKDVDRHGNVDLFEPISPRITHGAFIDDDAYVDPDEVMAALVRAARRLSIEMHPWAAAELTSTPNGVAARTERRSVRARCGIIATGASSHVRVDDVTAANHVRPIRGVTLRLAAATPAQPWMARGIVVGRHVYVIARGDGSIVVGATSEESDDTAVAARDIRQLLHDAVLIVPSLDDARFVESRVGLRPAPESHRPFFEHVGRTSWAWSGGYFRHGFLLAPLAARRAREFAEEFA